MHRWKFFGLVLCLLTTMAAGAQDSLLSAPVLFRGDTLFLLQTAPHNISVGERAALIEGRISSIYAQHDFRPDSLVLTEDSAASRILYKGQVVMTITSADAAASDLDRPTLARNYLTVIREKTGDLQSFSSMKQVLLFAAEALAVIAGLVLLIWLLNKLYRRVKLRYARRSYKPFVVGSYTFLTGERVRGLWLKTLAIIRLAVFLIIIYLALPVLFSIFPWTEKLADRLLTYVLDPLKDIFRNIAAYIPNLLTILVIWLFTRYIVKLVRFMAGEIERGVLKIQGFYSDWAQPTYNIVKVLLYAFMFVAIYPYLPGSGSGVFQGVTVFLGLLISIGSSSAIANMVAGIVITYMRPFRIGERIKVGEVTGDVIEKNMLVTRIRTIKNEDVTIPNALILGGQTINYSSCAQQQGLILHVEVTIGYDSPWPHIHKLLLASAAKTEGLLPAPQPFVLQTALSDYYVNYQLNAYTHEPERMAVIYSELYKNILDTFHEAGQEIMSPAYQAYRDGNSPAIPKKE
ncbi:mechanosensitive ion channel family protein [Chitinophaga rhizosphaerae]|uniref:mechanosensitive ion channel family protein n=1 Tax=Chitinophaga rhizosphaerae TaxID=1864947 RepID=UPI000F81359B|nr:mechanosensitive ion channel family protein [Chitinophaga rhizosphaerae]